MISPLCPVFSYTCPTGSDFSYKNLTPWDNYSISRVKSGLPELSQNVLISAGISQRSGYPWISPIFFSRGIPEFGISWNIPKVFLLKKGYPNLFSVLFGISQDIPHLDLFVRDIPGYVDFGLGFWDISGYP